MILPDREESSLSAFQGAFFENLKESIFSGFAIHEIITDESGKAINYRFLEVNPRFEQITSLLAKDIIGKTVLEFLPHIEYSWIEIYGEVALKGKKNCV